MGKDEKKKEKKEDSEKTVRDNIRKSLKEILTTRYGIQNYTWKLCYFRLLTKVTGRIFAFTRALCLGETLVLLDVVSQHMAYIVT